MFIYFSKKIPPAICNLGPIRLLNCKFFPKILYWILVSSYSQMCSDIIWYQNTCEVYLRTIWYKIGRYQHPICLFWSLQPYTFMNFGEMFIPVCLLGPIRQFGTLEYLLYHYLISAEWKRMCARFHGKKIEGNGSCKFHDFSVLCSTCIIYQILTFILWCSHLDKWFWQLIFSFDKRTRNM